MFLVELLDLSISSSFQFSSSSVFLSAVGILLSSVGLSLSFLSVLFFSLVLYFKNSLFP